MQPSGLRLCRKGVTAPLCSYGSQANVLLLISVGAGTGHHTEACVCSCQRAALLRDQPLRCFKAASRLAIVNRKEINWVPAGQLLHSVSVSLCCRQLVPGPHCRLSKKILSPCPAVPSLSVPHGFSSFPRKAQGQGSAGPGPILPDAEHPLGHLKAASWKLWIS